MSCTLVVMTTTIVTGALVLGLGLSLMAACGSDDDKKPAPQDAGTGGKQGWVAAVGDDGTFAQTFDDVLWHERTLTDRDLHAVACVGNNDGWAVGESGYVARSTDAGETWTEQHVATDKTLRAVRLSSQFSGAQGRFIGIVAGDAGTIAVTENGGDAWRLVPPLFQSTLRSVALSHGGLLMLAVGDAGAVARSSDRGATFATVNIDGAADLYGVAMDAGGDRVLAVDSAGAIWQSRDLGLTFEKNASLSRGLRAVAVSHDGKHALVAGNAGLIAEQHADGSWQSAPAPTGRDLFAALISHDGLRKYVSGDQGTLFSGDIVGGAWSQVPLKGAATLRGMENLDPR
jgi:photosystem II stability/assembly factor-like uncharacterized protein